MRSDRWHTTGDAAGFLARAGGFLRSNPALHTMPLTVVERLRMRGADGYGDGAPVFGWSESAGEVRAIFYRVRSGRLHLTRLTPEGADALAVRLTDSEQRLPGVSGDSETATAFAKAWQRHTGAVPALRERLRLYRLGTLTPPEPLPEGRGRTADEHDREQLIRWCREFVAAVGEATTVDTDSWAGTRFADKTFTFWETPDGTPVSMAGVTSMVAGQVRVDPVYTPARLRGRGYAGAVTAEATRVALAAGATEVVLFADAANPTSNALYQRLGYLPAADFAVYDFSGGA